MFLSTVSGTKGSEVIKSTLSSQHTFKSLLVHISCQVWYSTPTLVLTVWALAHSLQMLVSHAPPAVSLFVFVVSSLFLNRTLAPVKVHSCDAPRCLHMRCRYTLVKTHRRHHQIVSDTSRQQAVKSTRPPLIGATLPRIHARARIFMPRASIPADTSPHAAALAPVHL